MKRYIQYMMMICALGTLPQNMHASFFSDLVNNGIKYSFKKQIARLFGIEYAEQSQDNDQDVYDHNAQLPQMQVAQAVQTLQNALNTGLPQQRPPQQPKKPESFWQRHPFVCMSTALFVGYLGRSRIQSGLSFMYQKTGQIWERGKDFLAGAGVLALLYHGNGWYKKLTKNDKEDNGRNINFNF